MKLGERKAAGELILVIQFLKGVPTISKNVPMGSVLSA